MLAIVTCVNYDDFLRITLPRTLEAFDEVLVVTTLEDNRTRNHVKRLRKGMGRKLMCWPTHAFHRHHATFNKGAALDEAIACSHGDWICVLDADILLPEKMDLSGIQRGCLYSPRRRMMWDQGPIPPESEWNALEHGPEDRNDIRFRHQFGSGVGYAGYFHLFHADDLGPLPWYESDTWKSAQGCDTEFTMRWPSQQFRRPPFEVLHLGQPRVNWNGRVSERWDDKSTG